jgi:Icc protein
MPDTQTRIVQISDMHLFADKEKVLLGVKTYESSLALVNLLKQDKTPPHLIILSGDLSQDHSEASYLHVVELFEEFSIPIYYFPGNHDDGKLMSLFFPQGHISNLKNIILHNWQLILLDSQKFGAVEGFLDDLQLKFMEECLQSHPDHHAIVAFHHQPVSVGSEWVDNLGLKNAEEFWNIVQKYPRVRNILFGHIHQEYVGKKNEVSLYSTPSTCIQFKPNVPMFALDKLPPAYRWIDLHSNGTLSTGIIRCTHYVGEFDANAKGY